MRSSGRDETTTTRRILIHSDQRFARRLLSLLRDPVSVLSKVLIRELKVPSMERLRQILPSEAIGVLRVAEHFVIAFHHLVVLLHWRAAILDLPVYRATRAYVRAMRRHGVKVSQSSLYHCQDQFKKRGLLGLLPRWGGGRRRRIPPAERVLLEQLYRKMSFDRIYRLVRKGVGLGGLPVSRSSVQRVLKEISGHHVSNIHFDLGQLLTSRVIADALLAARRKR